MRLARQVLTIAAAGAVALFAGTALAQTVCLQLEAALINLDRGAAGSPADFARYDEAVRKQRGEIQRALAEARRANCIGGFLFFRQKPEPKCGALMAMIDRMQANLARLESRRDQYAYRPGGGSSWEKDRLLRALAHNNCGPQYAGYARRNTLMGSIFPGTPNSGAFWQQNDDFFPQQRLDYGTYRTLCVRTCDGYYFPISFSTVPSQFPRDEQICRQMCPGMDVKLFTHRNPGEDSESMVSTSGEPYAAQSYAFAYRTAYDPACTCRTAVAATRIGGVGVQPLAIATPVPIARPEASADPDTIANSFNGFTPVPVSPASHPAVAGLGKDRKRDGTAVRVVGPSYYYAQ
jgi:hypothetical protein